MKILALDLSLCRAGVARAGDAVAGQVRIDTETVEVPDVRVPGARPGRQKNAPRVGGARLAWWEAWLVEEIAGGTSLVAMEALAFSATDNNRNMAKLQGVVEVTCWKRGVPLVLVPPTTIKKYATGLGDCDKQRMIDTARDAYGSGVADEHQADAAHLCRLALDAFGDEGRELSAYQAGVAAKLREGLS